MDARQWLELTIGFKMLTLAKVALALVLAASSSFAVAQERAATDTELRAAYCLGVKQQRLTLMESNGSGPDSKDNVIRALYQKNQDEAQRLQVFLLARVSKIEPDGLAAALATGKNEAKTAYAESISCMMTPECKTAECIMACNARQPAMTRTDRCKDLSWMPY